MRLRTERRQRRMGGKVITMIVAAEDGRCARCTQPIVKGERIANERGHASHRDCIRLGVAVWRSRAGQVSDGWGNDCAECGAEIERGMLWSRLGASVVHRECVP